MSVAFLLQLALFVNILRSHRLHRCQAPRLHRRYCASLPLSTIATASCFHRHSSTPHSSTMHHCNTHHRYTLAMLSVSTSSCDTAVCNIVRYFQPPAVHTILINDLTSNCQHHATAIRLRRPRRYSAVVYRCLVATARASQTTAP